MRKPLYFVVALCTAALLFLTPAPSRADSVSGETDVVLNSSAVASLTGLGLTLSPLGQTTFNSSTMNLFMPITSGTIGASGDVFNMDGNGFALNKGSADITFRNLVINTGTGTITANVHFGNTQITGVTLFDRGAGGVLTLDAQAAGDIAAAFGTSNLKGTDVGTATVLIPLLGGIGGGSGSTSGSGGSTGTGGSTSGSGGTTTGSGGTTPPGPTSTPEPTTFALLAAASVTALGLFSLSRGIRFRLPRSA